MLFVNTLIKENLVNSEDKLFTTESTDKHGFNMFFVTANYVGSVKYRVI